MSDGTVIVIGGAEDKIRDRIILNRFVSLAGGETAVVAVISTASSLGHEAGERYRAIFGEMGVKTVRPLHAMTRAQANDETFARAVRDATGVFLTGGNQLRLSSTLGGTRLASAILDRFHDGVVVAGTSAGASADKTHHVLVVKPEITSPAQLRGRVVAISQPGGTVHRELLMILEKYKINPNEVKTASLGSTTHSLAALKGGNVDAAMLQTPLELYLEKDGFTPLVYLKDILEFPLLGIIVHADLLRDKPDQVRKVVTGSLKGIAFTKSHREEVAPLLKDFIGLDSLEMARKAYDKLRDIWPDSGMPTENGMKNVASIAEVPAGVPTEKLVDWSVVKEVAASLKAK